MFSKEDLLLAFASVENIAEHYFFQHKLPAITYEYCLKSEAHQDILVISEDITDKDFSIAVIKQTPDLLNSKKPTIFEISKNNYGFTHAIAVPSTYHESLKGRLEAKRENLYLCIPIFRCEFTGDEDKREFKEMMQRTIPIFQWKRMIAPKIRVYFDNPKTGAGTSEAGAIITYHTLLSEIENLNGVINGFIEITNYEEKIIEILSPANNAYTLIRNRKDEEVMDIASIIRHLKDFTTNQTP
ncbi:hypothetical protein [Pseudomonas sp. GW456-12-1-14-TSB6]|uniref:hypothetical protein n=1 Tax=Pseudomonas sp. GW456-12-1-14-TSB6 TaxID=2751350 RepID=UPI0015B16A1C|nr:hypothetical protein [Pseudomonas sp. GW456-12-1-14-TSB6]